MSAPDVVVVDAVRTPVGRHRGALADVRPDDLAALVLKAAVQRTGLDPALIEDVYMGCANQAGEDNRNVARMAVLLAGFPETVAGCTVNRLCGSGLEAIVQAGRAIRAGEGDVFLAGGVESMTRAPLVLPKPDEAYARGDRVMYDTTLGWRMTNPRFPYPFYSMGETAENVAEKYGVSREDQDRFAWLSQQKWKVAHDARRFRDELVPVEVPKREGETVVVDTDEHPRPDTTLEKLAKLPPAFREGGTVTAGNSSGINDGAAAAVLMSAERARALGLKPMARLVAAAVAGVNPDYMGMGPVPATRKALARAGLELDRIDVIEINEAFAAQSLACLWELGLDPLGRDADRVNPNGGAIAIGHPLGASGARIVATLLHELRRRGGRYGLATMCIGVGQGIAAVFERLD
ncbi:MAG: acetyl-CoA C-acyltransferase [Clostridia bacterium]|nr:acetyl-CoA C-acyltransferase [Clostridia bacterium]